MTQIFSILSSSSSWSVAFYLFNTCCLASVCRAALGNCSPNFKSIEEQVFVGKILSFIYYQGSWNLDIGFHESVHLREAAADQPLS